jgi:Protein of unknown function (DUF2703).
MKKELVIEWKHIEKDVGNTCERCQETGMTLAAVLAEIGTLLEMEGISVRMVETVLENDAVAESNSLLFNGVPIEELLEGIEVITTSCSSCSCLTCEENTECRALRYNGEEYETIPPVLIGRAAVKALELE